MMNQQIAKRGHLIIDLAWRRRRLILLPVLILMLIGSILGWQQPVAYLSDTTILVEPLISSDTMVNALPTEAQLRQEEKAMDALVHGRLLVETAHLLNLFSDNTPIPERNALLSKLSSHLKVVLIDKTLVRLSFIDNTPEKSMEILQAIAYVFIKTRLAAQDPSIIQINNKIAEMTAYLAMLRGRYTEQHTWIKTTRKQLSELKEQYAQMVQIPKKDFRKNVQQFFSANHLLAEQPATKTISTDTLTKDDAVLLGHSERVKVVDNPDHPTRVGYPFIIYLLSGFFSGLLLGGGCVLVSSWLDTRIRYQSQVQQLTGINVITRLPRY